MVTKPNTACVAALAIACAATCSAGPTHRCINDLESGKWGPAFDSCQAEFARTTDLTRAVGAAKAALYLQRPQDTLRLATLALDDPTTAADAHSIIGSAQLVLGNLDAAASHLHQALRSHRAAGDARAESRDQQQLAGVFYQLGEYQRALDAHGAARDAALRAHDERMAVYVDLALADILRAIGDLRGAEQAVELALAGAREPAAKVHALIRQGILHIEQGHAALARDPLRRALDEELASESPLPAVLEAVHLNLAYVERKAREFPRALAEMELAKKAGTDEMSYRLNRGLVLADMGKLDEARADLEAAEAEKPEGEWSWLVPFQRARVAALRHDIMDAIDSDHRAIKKVAMLALKSGVFGPTVIANHREPHLHLVGLLAADQRWSDVLDVVAAMDGQSLLDSNEVSVDPAPGELSASPLPSRSSPGQPAPDAKLAVEAWRGRQLTIVVPGGDRVWRLDVTDGRVSGHDAGAVLALGALARKLEIDPANIDAGRRLGQAMLPDVPARTRVDLLVIGPLARAPLAALRMGDGPAIARTPLVRAPGLLPRGTAARASGAAIAIGDPTGDLPEAANEARKLAARLEGTALIGGEATRAAFARTAGAGLLHVAAHTTRRRGGATLELSDGPVSLDDIAKLAPAPRVVVLASCGASAGRDDAGNGSLTTAFLSAGAEVVIGTRWSVGDAEAARFVDAFYAARGDREPVRALVEAQLASKLPATTWAAFEVFVARPAR
jgi:tetratricopeptide (TPR) repeat protein